MKKFTVVLSVLMFIAPLMAQQNRGFRPGETIEQQLARTAPERLGRKSERYQVQRLGSGLQVRTEAAHPSRFERMLAQYDQQPETQPERTEMIPPAEAQQGESAYQAGRVHHPVRPSSVEIPPKPGNPGPDAFADERATLASNLVFEGVFGWMTDADKQQYQDYVGRMLASRFQILEAASSRDLQANMNEVAFANSQWTANASNPKTVGNMQNADYQAVINITAGNPEYGNFCFGQGSFRFCGASVGVDVRVTLKIVAVNNRAILEMGTGSARGSAATSTNITFRGQTANGGGNGHYEAVRKGVINALVEAAENLRYQ